MLGTEVKMERHEIEITNSPEKPLILWTRKDDPSSTCGFDLLAAIYCADKLTVITSERQFLKQSHYFREVREAGVTWIEHIVICYEPPGGRDITVFYSPHTEELLVVTAAWVADATASDILKWRLAQINEHRPKGGSENILRFYGLPRKDRPGRRPKLRAQT